MAGTSFDAIILGMRSTPVHDRRLPWPWGDTSPAPAWPRKPGTACAHTRQIDSVSS